MCYMDGGLIETVGLRGCTIKRGKVRTLAWNIVLSFAFATTATTWRTLQLTEKRRLRCGRGIAAYLD